MYLPVHPRFLSFTIIYRRKSVEKRYRILSFVCGETNLMPCTYMCTSKSITITPGLPSLEDKLHCVWKMYNLVCNSVLAIKGRAGEGFSPTIKNKMHMVFINTHYTYTYKCSCLAKGSLRYLTLICQCKWIACINPWLSG